VIVALADSRVRLKAIAVVVERSVWTVRRWIQRNKTTKNVNDGLRSGRPALYSEEMKLRLVAFYCQTQPLPDCGRWTLRWAERFLKAHHEQIDAAPSKSTIHQILSNNKLKPHQSRYFLHITDPDFLPKMEHLLDLFKNPPQHLFFFDECPGIQVLRRLTPDLQTETMKQRLEEFEYIRNGTMDLFAFLNHADGKVAVECHANHTIDTFVGVFTRHVQQYNSEASLHYVMDNLSSHSSYGFCQAVAKLSAIACPKENELDTQIKRVRWLQRKDKRIILHYTPCHGSWLNWVEIWFGIIGAKVLRESFGSPDALKRAIEAFAETWNLLWAHPFKWSWDGKDLHDKAIARFTKMLCAGAQKMELRTLTKLIMLTTNLLKDYFSQVSKETWRTFAETLSAQNENIIALIQQEKGLQRKNKALLAFSTLTTALQQHEFWTKDLAA
jgi:transposase